MAEEIREILNEIKEIRVDIGFIKKNMPDKEMFLTAEEKKLLEESYDNEKRGKLLSSQSLRNNLGI